MLYSRWLALGVLLLLVFFIVLYDREEWKQKARNYGMMFIEGMVGGFIIDVIGINAGYYYFPRQPFLSVGYFAIVIPCWGVFGLLVNCLWQWVGKERFIRGMMATMLPLFAFYEGTNLLTGSWIYTTSFYVVAPGWIPLVWTFAGCNRRRRVVFKIEAWKLRYQEDKLSHYMIYQLLNMARVILTIAMFPLLFTMLIRVGIALPRLIKQDMSILAYTKYLLVMK